MYECELGLESLREGGNTLGVKTVRTRVSFRLLLHAHSWMTTPYPNEYIMNDVGLKATGRGKLEAILRFEEGVEYVLSAFHICLNKLDNDNYYQLRIN